jgi:hypothetical protein
MCAASILSRGCQSSGFGRRSIALQRSLDVINEVGNLQLNCPTRRRSGRCGCVRDITQADDGEISKPIEDQGARDGWTRRKKGTSGKVVDEMIAQP